MAIFWTPGEQEPRGLVTGIHAVVENQFELVSAGDLAVNRQIHAMKLGGHCTFQLAGKGAHQTHVIVVLLATWDVPLGYHKRTVLSPIVLNVLCNLRKRPVYMLAVIHQLPRKLLPGQARKKIKKRQWRLFYVDWLVRQSLVAELMKNDSSLWITVL